MRLVFAGTPEIAVPALEALLASDHEVVAVVTRPDARQGRGRTLHPSPVKAVDSPGEVRLGQGTLRRLCVDRQGVVAVLLQDRGRDLELA